MKIMYRLCESLDEIIKAQAGHLTGLFCSRNMVPHIIEGDTYFLKTIIPSRVHTKHFFTK